MSLKGIDRLKGISERRFERDIAIYANNAMKG